MVHTYRNDWEEQNLSARPQWTPGSQHCSVKHFLSSFAFHVLEIGEIDIRERGCFPSGVKYFSTQYTQPLGLNFAFVLVPG